MSGATLKLSEAKAAYYAQSGKLSDVTRQLALAGIAIVWIFKKDTVDGPHVDGGFVPATLWLIYALGADLLHYIFGTAGWGIYARVKEQQAGIENDSDLSAPTWLNWGPIFFLMAKVVLVIVAYCCLSQKVWAVFRTDSPGTPQAVQPVGPAPAKSPNQ